MGQEISKIHFTKEDESIFFSKLREETKVLKSLFDNDKFESDQILCGLELEAWLVDENFIPSPSNEEFLEKLNHELVVPEISKYNFELNSEPSPIKTSVFSDLENETMSIWQQCEKVSNNLSNRPLLIGTLPTLREHMLSVDTLSAQKRYTALNSQVMKLRDGRPISIDFEGRDLIELKCDNVITECAATSLQIHFGVTQHTAVKYYNASIISSAFVSAVSANSPFFFGKELWDESRIPIFEQSVYLHAFRRVDGKFATRVSLGNGYVKNSLFELFIENLDGYPALLPETYDSPAETLKHLRLHNGTIWRWNRPLIGFDKDSKPSLRLEFRVPSAGPTITDSIANMVFQIGLVEYFYTIEDLEEKISFNSACENFYNCCKTSFDAEIKWIDKKEHNIQKLLLDKIIPNVKLALRNKNIDEDDIEKYITNNIEKRIRSGQNGAKWQKSFIATHGVNFQEMLEKYYEYQKENTPVYLWKV